MHIIGLTGGIASGKSTVARLMEQHGLPVIDADQLAREVVAPGEPAFEKLVACFGPGILDAAGNLDRARLAGIVFADPEARQRLEAITHPAIRRRAEEQLASLEAAGCRVAVYMAPLLIEAGAASRVDEIWVVYVDRETQLRRLMARDNSSREEASRRIDAQMPMEEKRLLARNVIDNRGNRQELEQQVAKLMEQAVT